MAWYWYWYYYYFLPDCYCCCRDLVNRLQGQIGDDPHCRHVGLSKQGIDDLIVVLEGGDKGYEDIPYRTSSGGCGKQVVEPQDT